MGKKSKAAKSQLKSCGVLIVHGEPVQEFLLMRHADRWDLPKGHIDPGETELECALREMEEETGIPASSVQIDPDFRWEQQYQVNTARSNWKTVWKSLIIYLARIPGSVDVVVTEHQGSRWFPWQPPHKIQERTIDPLLAAAEEYLQSQS